MRHVYTVIDTHILQPIFTYRNIMVEYGYSDAKRQPWPKVTKYVTVHGECDIDMYYFTILRRELRYRTLPIGTSATIGQSLNYYELCDGNYICSPVQMVTY